MKYKIFCKQRGTYFAYACPDCGEELTREEVQALTKESVYN